MSKCPVCGKEFTPAPFHVYKVYVKSKACYKLACSWHCVRKWEKNNDKD